jgi:hypothetical protein
VTPKNPRRIVLADLATSKRALAWLAKQWNVPGDVYDDGGYRARRPDEYPENRPQDWSQIYKTLGDLIDILQALRSYAADQYHRTSTPEETTT